MQSDTGLNVSFLPSPARVYARVDMIWDNDNLPAVSELELIAPQLWLRNCLKASVALAEAVCQQPRGSELHAEPIPPFCLRGMNGILLWERINGLQLPEGRDFYHKT